MSAAYHSKDALRIEAAALVLVKNAGSHLTYTVSETSKKRPKPRPTVPELHNTHCSRHQQPKGAGAEKGQRSTDTNQGFLRCNPNKSAP